MRRWPGLTSIPGRWLAPLLLAVFALTTITVGFAFQWRDADQRVTELETHLKYIRRDMDEVRGDVRTIKHRLAYSAGATAVILGLLGWVANSRFDQLVTLISN